MSISYLYRSADLKVNGFAENVTNTGIVKIVIEHFASENVKILSVQQCPGKIARVIFQDRDAYAMIRLRGELQMDGVKVAVLPLLPPPPPNWVNVIVYGLPYDAPSSYVEDALRFLARFRRYVFSVISISLMLRLARELYVSTLSTPFRGSSNFTAIAARCGTVASPYIVISAGKAPISHLIVLLRVNAWPVVVPVILRENDPKFVLVVKVVMPPTPVLIVAVGSGFLAWMTMPSLSLRTLRPLLVVADAEATVTPEVANVDVTASGVAGSNKATPVVPQTFNFL